MSALPKIYDHDAIIRRDMEKWAKYRSTQANDIINLGYPSQSAEQMAGLVRGDFNKPGPEIDLEIEIDRIVNTLNNDLKRVIYCRYKIPMELADVEQLNIPFCIMERRGKMYFWSSHFGDCRNAIGLGRYQFEGLLNYAMGKIEGKLYG